MTAEEIKNLFKEHKEYKFYKTREWRLLRAQVMNEARGECKWCKEKGIISKAETVHHVKHVKDFPELALSRTYIDAGGSVKPNLIPLCHECHDKAHKRIRYQPKPEPLNEERW